MAEEQKNIPSAMNEADIPATWQDVDVPPVTPGVTPSVGGALHPNDMPPYFRATLNPDMQHDVEFVGTKKVTSQIPVTPLMPTAPSASPQLNSAVQNIIKVNSGSTSTAVTVSGMIFRGVWTSFTTYQKQNVVLFNNSAYVAITGSLNSQPDLNPLNWTLLSENLVFNGTYPAQFNAGGFGPIDAAGVTGASATSAAPTVTATSSGTFANEVALVFVSNDNAGFTFTPPPGWNLLYNISGASHLYWKPIAGGSTVTFTASLSTPDDWEALIAFFGFGGFAGFSITQVQTSPTVLTVTAANSLVAGNYVTFFNLANATFLNGQSGFVASASPTQFTINSVYGNPNYGPTADTGTASLTMLQATAEVSGGGGPNAVGFTQATTKGSTFIYTDLWEGHTGPSGAVSSVGDNNIPSNVYQLANTDDGACLAAAQNHGALSTPTILPLSSGLQLSSGAIGFEIPGSVQSITPFLPFDVVEFRGSVFVCLSETSGDAFTAPTKWGLLGPATGFVQSKSGNYTAVRGDEGNLLSFSSSSAVTLTLPNPIPAHPQVIGMTDSGWWIPVQNIGTGVLTISPNGLLIDGLPASITLGQNQGVAIFTDGSNYFTFHGVNRITVPAFLTASAPDSSGNITIGLSTQSAGTALMGPIDCSGPALPTFRRPQGTDFVNLSKVSAIAVNTAGNQSGNFRFCGSVLPAGTYRISMYVVVTNAGTGNLSMTITWNDGTASQTFSPSNISTTVVGTFAQFDINVLSDGVHDITYAVNLI
jgi:hypothetical protein